MKQIMAENNTINIEETQKSEPDISDSVNNIFAGASSQSGIILGGVDMNKHGSSVTNLDNPLNYAGHLCTLVNNQKEEHRQKSKEIETLDKLPSMIRKIYLKIREQLEDDTHPIIWIIKQFQIAFKADIEERIAEVQRMTEEAANQTKLQFSGNTNGPAMHSNVAQHPVGHSFQD